MGVLTEQVSRLCAEIRSLRGARQSLINGLVRCRKDRRNSLAEMRARFATAHAEMVRHTTTDRLAFLSGVRQTVASQRRDLRADLAGARCAWSGLHQLAHRPAPFEKANHLEDGARVGQARASTEQISQDRPASFRAKKRKPQSH